MLFQNQEKCKLKIDNFINNEKENLIIEGNRNIGEITTILESLQSMKDSEYILLRNEHSNSRNYIPFYGAINDKKISIRDIVHYDDEIAKDIKVAPHLLSIFIKLLKKRKSNFKLNEEEQNILSYLQRLVKHKSKYIFIIENVSEWDDSSIQLFSVLYNDFISNRRQQYKWIFTSNSKKESNFIKNNFVYTKRDKVEIHCLQNMDINDFIKCISFFDKNFLYSKEEYNNLFKILDSDIEAIKFICKNGKNSTFFDEDDSKLQLLKNVIERKLKDLNAYGNLIIETMEYVSILNEMVSVDELIYIMDKQEGEIRSIIDEANRLYLLSYEDVEERYINFALEIVKSIYTEISKYDIQYYKKIVKAISLIEPSNYKKRGDLLLKTDEKNEAGLCYCLEYLKQTRENERITEDFFRRLELSISDEQQEFISSYRVAVEQISQNNYSKALEILYLITIVPNKELSVEKDILISLCKTKFLNQRKEALDILESYQTLSDVNNEIDLWERVQDRKLFANVHLGDLNCAYNLEKNLLLSYSKRIQHDKKALLNIIKLEMRSNSMYSAEVTLSKIERAYDRFIKNSYNNLRLYFILLANSAAAYIMNGQFDKAFEKCEEGKALLDTEEYIVFPRKEILLNNYLISGYLSGKLTNEYCISEYKKIIKKIENGAEKIFYISNYSIMLSLNNENEKAFQILLDEANFQHVEELDKENLYNFRVCYNLAVFSYLSHDADNINKYTEKLIDCSIDKNDQKYNAEKRKIALQLLKSKQKYSAYEWLLSIKKEKPVFSGAPWEYYGLGYVFTALSNWNDF